MGLSVDSEWKTFQIIIELVLANFGALVQCSA
jgi:hypothetical protein